MKTSPENVRQCSKCGHQGPLEDFTKQRSSALGRTHVCCKCSAARAREYRARNLEACKERGRRWHQEHREVALKKMRLYRLEHGEVMNENTRLWRLENRDAYLASAKRSTKRWTQAHPERANAARRRYAESHPELIRNVKSRYRHLIKPEDAQAHFRRWEEADDILLLRWTGSTKELALRLGRTMSSITARRHNLKKE